MSSIKNIFTGVKIFIAAHKNYVDQIIKGSFWNTKWPDVSEVEDEIICEKRGHIPLQSQFDALGKAYSELRDLKAPFMGDPPEGSEWCAVKNIWQQEPDSEEEYQNHVWQAFKKLGGTGGENERLAFTEEQISHSIMREISKEQGHPAVLIIPVRLISSSKVTEKMTNAGMFGLGSFVIANILITHKEKIEDFKKKPIYCPGDTYCNHKDVITVNKYGPRIILTNTPADTINYDLDYLIAIGVELNDN